MPGKLYRVFDDLSVSIFDEEDGFKAGDTDPFNLQDDQAARLIVERHSDWNNRLLTPLVSATDSYHHARRLGEGKMRWRGTNLRVAVIDLSASGHVFSYPMSQLVAITRANVSVSPGPHEYVCVHHIPRRAVLKVYAFQEFVDYCVTQDELNYEADQQRSHGPPTIPGEGGVMYHSEEEAYEAKDQADLLEYMLDH